MINIIYGLKGSGKTAKIIDRANDQVRETKGTVLFLTDRRDHSRAVSNKIRFVCVKDYGIDNESSCVPFFKGLLAGNYDITDIYVDGLARFTGMKVEEMENIYKDIDLLSSDHKVDFTFTVTVDKVPDYMKKYI